MPRTLRPADLADLARPGHAVFVAGATAEPTAILDAWRAARCLDGVTLVGVQIPGLDRVVPEAFGDTCRVRTAFLSPALRPGFAAGRVELLPMHHAAFYRWLVTAAIDLAVFQVAPPDRDGRCNLGPGVDLLPALLDRRDVRLVAQINPRLPRCRDGVSVALNRLDAVYEADGALPEFTTAGRANGDADALADHAASLVEDGATVQIGIGRVPDRVLARLADRQNLRLHGGTVSAAGLALCEAGVATGILAGVALGDAAFYARVAAADGVAFRPVSVTHDAAALAATPRLIAFNAAFEVDLFGQANGETADGRLVASFGGINAFLRAAQASPGGRAVVMLPATAARGTVSRIVPRISSPGLVAVQRGDIDSVVTEHGVADLRGLDLDRRAQALIAIADPRFRDGLAASWRDLRAPAA
ncbi:MAG: 4-hydroxybutyrate coenzyme A transferase [Alphaproteobacteria bacterium]|nr:4-hydroxybutyrate coenzyme A transferase [Alphaproteobacteria bacterium]